MANNGTVGQLVSIGKPSDLSLRTTSHLLELFIGLLYRTLLLHYYQFVYNFSEFL